ncbi:MAG: DUF2029 domain-containing protein [Acidobacteria bacterium]|nr:DUF2029 domain-containing protein [Acidobacteriota bacterium]NIM60649.1 DUF2029 domain-containing protein [Acidobacteriota bacterium]NIO57936.1 DUF2029 domain-containing protein [Acidobacteriota bacterium]NIQ28939.1 DUF2029 domain-containing protein [Acidobacteriota bacterium]NIQ83413.1 DUF2029 domain-containing protein [Acidobacteriota bacterium]
MVKQAWGRLSALKRIAVCLLLLVSLFHFAAGSWGAAEYGFVDLSIFLQLTAEFAAGGDLYVPADHVESYKPSAAVYKFPPLFAVLLLPQVQGGVHSGLYKAHWIAHMLLYLGAVALLASALGRRAPPAFVFVLVLAALNLEPYFETLWRLQLETPILFLCALGLWLELRGRPIGAGAALGVAAMLKVYPIFLLGWFIVRRSGRGLAGAALAILATGALGWWVVGSEQNLLYWTVILPRLMQEVPSMGADNVALTKPLQRLIGIDPGIAKRVVQALALAALSAGYWVLYRHGKQRRPEIDAELSFGLFVCTMLLFMPNLWSNYLVLLIIPIASILSHLFGSFDEVPAPALGTLAFAYFLMLFYTPCAPFDPQTPCTRDPLFLGIFAWPRELHDLLVEWKTLATAAVLAVWFVVARRAGAR